MHDQLWCRRRHGSFSYYHGKIASKIASPARTCEAQESSFACCPCCSLQMITADTHARMQLGGTTDDDAKPPFHQLSPYCTFCCVIYSVHEN
ncbi:hypothetical protein DAI22_10g095500 [Oryza sativa Japonica Group]|nr:hypothetical protein DAI22_10g095500 [Oryza sativa Japonica Group]